MLRLMAALAILLACGIAPVSYAQDDCDEEALAAGECGGEADDADEESVDADSEGPVDDEMADAEWQPEDENVEPMADEESGDEDAAADEGADLSDTAETDEAAGEDTAAAGAEEEESDADVDAEITAATDEDDAGADAASGDDPLLTPPPGAPDAPRSSSGGVSAPAPQTLANPVTPSPAPPVAPAMATKACGEGARRSGNGEHIQGTIKSFNATKGFGFIQRDDGAPDVFVHISAVERAAFPTLEEGQRITFEVQVDGCGKASAVQLGGVGVPFN